MRVLTRSLVVCAFTVAALAVTYGAALSIRGKVVDTSGAAIPGATVEITQDSTRVVGSTIADENGAFAVAGLLPGEYVVTAALTGFRSASQTVVLREGALAAPLELRLELDGIQETITV